MAWRGLFITLSLILSGVVGRNGRISIFIGLKKIFTSPVNTTLSGLPLTYTCGGVKFVSKFDAFADVVVSSTIAGQKERGTGESNFQKHRNDILDVARKLFSYEEWKTLYNSAGFRYVLGKLLAKSGIHAAFQRDSCKDATEHRYWLLAFCVIKDLKKGQAKTIFFEISELRPDIWERNFGKDTTPEALRGRIALTQHVMETRKAWRCEHMELDRFAKLAYK